MRWLFGADEYAEVTPPSMSRRRSGRPIASLNACALAGCDACGIEAAICDHLSAKLEALYMDFGDFDTGFGGLTNTNVTNQLNNPSTGFNTVTTTTSTTAGNFHSRVNDVILRVGLNYRFGVHDGH